MDIKRELGKKIHLLRQDRGLSRQDLCKDEDILSTRQLQRIEKGDSIPSVATVVYLAQQFGISVDDLVNKDVYFLPKDYQELKYQLFRIAHFGDPEKLQEREGILEEIYETYFDQLPEEEQLTIQLFQAGLDIVTSGDVEFDQGLYDDYFPQVFMKKRLTVNDLLLIKLHFVKMGISRQLEVSKTQKLAGLVKEAKDYTPVEELFLVQENLLNLAAFYFFQEDYQELSNLLTLVEQLMAKRHDFRDKPGVLMFRWKLALFEDKDISEAEEFYRSAIQLCDWTNQPILKARLLEEWQSDFETVN